MRKTSEVLDKLLRVHGDVIFEVVLPEEFYEIAVRDSDEIDITYEQADRKYQWSEQRAWWYGLTE